MADDTDVFIILLHVSISCNETLYFRQDTTSSRDGITHHNVSSLSSQLREKICAILPAFHSLTGSDFTKPFFGRSKITSFKKLLSKSEYGFKVIHEYWSCWYRERNVFCVTRNLQSSGARKITWRYSLNDAACWKRQKNPFSPTKSLPPDQKSLTMKILRAHLVSHSWVNCLDCNYHLIFWVMLDFCRWCSTTLLVWRAIAT